MDELRCDPGWVEEQLQDFFRVEGGPLGVGEAASPEVLEYFEDIFPASTLQVPFPDQRWWCITRTPMGSMRLWGEVSGPALKIVSVFGFLYPDSASHRNMLDPVMRERMGCNRLLSLTKDSARDDVSRRRLAGEGFKKFGSLGPKLGTLFWWL